LMGHAADRQCRRRRSVRIDIGTSKRRMMSP